MDGRLEGLRARCQCYAGDSGVQRCGTEGEGDSHSDHGLRSRIRCEFRYMRAAEATVAGVPARLLRIGFVGEAGWELHVPAEHAVHVWDAVLNAGAALGIAPFGVGGAAGAEASEEALHSGPGHRRNVQPVRGGRRLGGEDGPRRLHRPGRSQNHPGGADCAISWSVS